MKRIASIQDVSCLGRCSQTVALPVVSTMGVECAILPTAVLSTHTSFPDFRCLDLTDQLLPVARHWKAQGVRFDALYTGYLASDRQVAVVLELLELLREEGTLLFVDPAMADHGKLYAGFGPEFPALMAQVVSKAQITVPNITEASLMTGLPKTITVTSTEMLEAFEEPVERILEAIHGVLERTPPELVADISNNGIVMTGGGSLVDGFDKLIEARTGIHTMVADDAISCVAEGTGKSLDSLNAMTDGTVNLSRRKQMN